MKVTVLKVLPTCPPFFRFANIPVCCYSLLFTIVGCVEKRGEKPDVCMESASFSLFLEACYKSRALPSPSPFPSPSLEGLLHHSSLFPWLRSCSSPTKSTKPSLSFQQLSLFFFPFIPSLLALLKSRFTFFYFFFYLLIRQRSSNYLLQALRKLAPRHHLTRQASYLPSAHLLLLKEKKHLNCSSRLGYFFKYKLV